MVLVLVPVEHQVIKRPSNSEEGSVLADGCVVILADAVVFVFTTGVNSCFRREESLAVEQGDTTGNLDAV